MLTYDKFLDELSSFVDPDFATFQRRLIDTKQTILGVRTPVMRKLAKKYQREWKTLFAFPDEFYEVTFIKLSALSLRDYETLVKNVGDAVLLMDNWATCDCFRTKTIEKHKREFLSVLETIFVRGGEFDERYVFVTLLTYYVEENYADVITSYIRRANTQRYYVHMAVAWLVAELLVKEYEIGLKILRSGMLDGKTHDKAIQKAKESFRVSKERKEFLNSLKIKNQNKAEY